MEGSRLDHLTPHLLLARRNPDQVRHPHRTLFFLKLYIIFAAKDMLARDPPPHPLLLLCSLKSNIRDTELRLPLPLELCPTQVIHEPVCTLSLA